MTQKTVQQQKEIILAMLEQAKIKSTIAIKAKLDETQKIINDESILSMNEVIRRTNLLVANLEHLEEAKPTLKFLEDKGFYRMLYRNPKVKGQELPQDDILNKLLRYGFIGVGISALLIAAFVTTMLLSAPFWVAAIATGLFVGASVYASGILYGVVNDLFATHANLPYFLLGHQPQQSSLLRTNDKIAQGIAWGVAATFGPVVLATIVFTVAATVTAFFVPMATFILPILIIAMPLIAVGAEFYARKKTKEYSDERYLSAGSNEYQWDGLDFMSPTHQERAAWNANSDRNMFGFTKVPILGLVGLVALITLSAVSMFLPAVLFTLPLAAVIIPAAFAGLAVLALAAGGLYLYVNRNRHVDDRNNLDFENAAVNYDLYLDEDSDYVNALLAERGQRKTVAANEPELKSTASNHFAPLFSPQQGEVIEEESKSKLVF